MQQFQKALAKLSLIFSLCLSLTSPAPAQATGPGLVISEINPFGSLNETNCKTVDANNRCGYDKWLEIHNPTTSSINLKDWSLQFRQSGSNNDNLLFIQDIILPPDGFYLVGYKEVNYQSTLVSAGLNPGGVTGKIRNLSNKSSGSIQVNLLNPERQTEFEVNLQAGDFPGLLAEEKRQSLEYVGGNWTLSTNEFYRDNFGTPRNTVVAGLDLDSQPSDAIVVAPPLPKTEPKNDPTPPPKKPEPAASPKSESQPATKPEIAPEPIQKAQPAKPEKILNSNTQAEPVKSEIKAVAPQNLIEPSPYFAEQKVKTILDEAEKAVQTNTTNVESLIQKQASIFQSSSVPVVEKVDANNSTNATATSYSQTKDLWEYFFSYQALGVLVILLSAAYAFSSRESLSQSFSVGHFQHDFSRVLGR